MTDFNLDAQVRKDPANQLRKEGFIPAIVYGKGFENVQIALEKINFLKVFREAGTSNLIDVKIDGDKNIKTLIHDIQLDPIKSDILHVDFYKVNMKEKIHADIPLKFVGDSIAVIDKEGSLMTSKDSIEVECLPSDLIPELEVDISALDDFEKNIKISDLKVPAGVEILDDPEEIIAHVEEPRSDEELEELEAEVVEDVSAIEVENAGEAPAEGEAAESEKAEEKKSE